MSFMKTVLFQFCYNLRYLSLRKKSVTAENAYQKLKIKHDRKNIIVSISPKVNVKVKL